MQSPQKEHRSRSPERFAANDVLRAFRGDLRRRWSEAAAHTRATIRSITHVPIPRSSKNRGAARSRRKRSHGVGSAPLQAPTRTPTRRTEQNHKPVYEQNPIPRSFYEAKGSITSRSIPPTLKSSTAQLNMRSREEHAIVSSPHKQALLVHKLFD